MRATFPFISVYTNLPLPRPQSTPEMYPLPHLLPALGCLALCLTAQAAHVTHTLTLTWETGAPDGQSREMIFTNGQFPAPALTFDEGDDVEVSRHLREWEIHIN